MGPSCSPHLGSLGGPKQRLYGTSGLAILTLLPCVMSCSVLTCCLGSPVHELQAKSCSEERNNSAMKKPSGSEYPALYRALKLVLCKAVLRLWFGLYMCFRRVDSMSGPEYPHRVPEHPKPLNLKPCTHVPNRSLLELRPFVSSHGATAPSLHLEQPMYL